jgi:hypothetical protein
MGIIYHEFRFMNTKVNAEKLSSTNYEIFNNYFWFFLPTGESVGSNYGKILEPTDLPVGALK